MDRLSGVYKRWTQLLSFLIALALAVLLNIDGIVIAKAVWEHPTLVDNLKPPAGASGTAQISASGSNTSGGTQTDAAAKAREALKTLDQYLPVGWPGGFWKQVAKDDRDEPLKDDKGKLKYIDVGWDSKFIAPAVIGWLVTAIATLFGAPFWFDALQRFTRLKGAGPSPAEKKTQKEAAAQ
jgi:hypothetical protein